MNIDRMRTGPGKWTNFSDERKGTTIKLCESAAITQVNG